jgi:hypothetical protein
MCWFSRSRTNRWYRNATTLLSPCQVLASAIAWAGRLLRPGSGAPFTSLISFLPLFTSFRLGEDNREGRVHLHVNDFTFPDPYLLENSFEEQASYLTRIDIFMVPKLIKQSVNIKIRPQHFSRIFSSGQVFFFL